MCSRRRTARGPIQCHGQLEGTGELWHRCSGRCIQQQQVFPCAYFVVCSLQCSKCSQGSQRASSETAFRNDANTASTVQVAGLLMGEGAPSTTTSNTGVEQSVDLEAIFAQVLDPTTLGPPCPPTDEPAFGYFDSSRDMRALCDGPPLINTTLLRSDVSQPLRGRDQFMVCFPLCHV